MRYVFDTNVIVSALLFENSKPAQAFRYALKHGQVLFSCDSLEELSDVLERQKFDRYVEHKQRKKFLQALAKLVVLVEITTCVSACRDPKDNKFLDVALSGMAQYLITGDNDLLELNPLQNVNIVTVEEFLRIIASN